MRQNQSRQKSYLHDDLLYIPTDESGLLDIPMKGGDITRINTCGYYEAIDYAARRDVARWLSQYSDELIFKEALQCSDCDAEELAKEDRLSWLGYIIFSYALELTEYDDPAFYLAAEEFVKEWNQMGVEVDKEYCYGN